jgi:hypothetical protein
MQRMSRLRSGVSSAAIVSLLSLSTGCGDQPGSSPAKQPQSAQVGLGSTADAGTNAPTVEKKVSALVGPDDPIPYGDFGESPSPSDASWAATVAELIALAKDAKTAAGYITAVVGAVNATIGILQLIGILPKSDEVATAIADLNAIGTGITWQALQNYIDPEYADIVTATTQAIEDPSTVYPGGPYDQASNSAAYALTEGGAWSRSVIGSGNDASTDGDWIGFPVYTTDQYGNYTIGSNWPQYPDSWDDFSLNGVSLKWKQVVPGRPAITADGGQDLVFEWRMGAPFALKGIAGRLAVIATMDPSFKTDRKHDLELQNLFTGLEGNFTTMMEGVQCADTDKYFAHASAHGAYPYTVPAVQAYECVIVCADIYTGIASLSSVTPPIPSSIGGAWPNGYQQPGGSWYDYSAMCENTRGSAAYVQAYNAAVYGVRKQMPLFEMRSMLDHLYQIIHHQPDLTQTYSRIPVQNSANYCLDVPAANPAAGTPLQLWPCNGTAAQNWSYNRATGQIENPILGTCVDVQWANTQPWTTVWSWPCTTPTGTPPQIDNPAQEWTYSAEHNILVNKLGVSLGAADLFAGAQVYTTSTGLQGLEFSQAATGGAPRISLWHHDGYVKGDLNGDGYSDIMLAGDSWSYVPIASNGGNGVFWGASLAPDDGSYLVWAASPGVKAVAGDFDGDGISDVALTGVSNWGSIPVGFVQPNNGVLHITNATNPDMQNFAYWASSPNVQTVSGDFDGDGRSDIAIVGNSNWTTIPIAFSNGDGSFHVTNASSPTFASYAATPGAKAVAGDFNGDGKSDIALVGFTASNVIPVAISGGDGTFVLQTPAVTAGDANFTYYSTLPGVKAVAGDFDGDGRADIALTGGAGWWTIPVAYWVTNTSMRVTNSGISSGDTGYPTYATGAGVLVASGDFNHDGKSDIALLGGTGWWTIPVAFSNGDGTWGVTNNSTQGLNIPAMAASSGAIAVGAY